jgi:hypothetical protein
MQHAQLHYASTKVAHPRSFLLLHPALTTMNLRKRFGLLSVFRLWIQNERELEYKIFSCALKICVRYSIVDIKLEHLICFSKQRFVQIYEKLNFKYLVNWLRYNRLL